MNPPNPAEEVFFTFAGVIDDAATQRIFHSFSLAVQNKVKRAHLLIQSFGGAVGSGVAIYNFLRGVPIDLTTYNCGSVCSIAVTVYLSGKTRIASSNSSFLIHKTTASFNSPVGISSIQARAESVELDDRIVESILREHIEMADAKWDAHSKS